MSTSQLNYLFQFCKKGSAKQLTTALIAVDETDIVDERGNTLLCVALKYAQWNTVKVLLETDRQFSLPQPALITACQCSKDDNQGIALVLQLNPDVNVINKHRRTALMTACLLGHAKKAMELLVYKASCDLQDANGNTALMEAVNSNNKKLVALILQQKPEINQSNRFFETALLICIKQKAPQEEILKSLLIAGADPEVLDASKKSAWLIAKQKHPKLAKVIERHLNKVNQIELPIFNTSPVIRQETKKQINLKPLSEVQQDKQEAQFDELHNVINKSVRIEPIFNSEHVKNEPNITNKSFIFNKEKVKKTNQQEWFSAAKSGNLGKLNRMIVEGIDINCKDSKGCTALIRACGHSRRAVVSFLLQQNANIETRSENGSTALSSSIIGNCRRVAGLLLENKADANGLGPSNYSYATIAAAQWNDAMLSILYRHGGDIFIKNKQQQTLLHVMALAAEFYTNVNNAKTTVQFLLDHSLEIDAQDHMGNTALLIFCGAHKRVYKADDKNIASIVYSMMKLGASPAITNKEGKSALDYANNHKLQQTKAVIMNALSWNT